ncbi:hypothetical protein T552_01955 [Pneumocystis carinii B80]|uniref:Mitochondrial GTP/GDP carrier protein 1 n=1 Tax=Pneumocystis carinii (strain B80) TaxID=1408658 RepID=A0A0W4ZIA1_PNEC8|nr:hypothetical protein T552_01955 [Pneumocystis carinii B80]KTW28094.1 hypothetical protein T552_01955 [Pneumocystis carinii B80]
MLTTRSTKTPVSNHHKESNIARIMGSVTAGILELGLFHPIDTISKRLMSNQGRITSLSHLNKVIFNKNTLSPLSLKFISLFPGLEYAAGYKILQRVYKYSGQPIVTDYLSSHYGGSFQKIFGKENSKAMIHATAGSIIGVGEIILLPLDMLKVKHQTNPDAFKGRKLFQIIIEENFKLYRGWGWTAARNAPGSFSLFGGNALAKEHLFGLSDYTKATWLQNFVASIAGAVASLTISAPLDVIKTRIQNQNFDHPRSGLSILKSMIKNEGIFSFFKGLTPKILTVGPKLVFSFTLAQSLTPMFDTFFSTSKKHIY